MFWLAVIVIGGYAVYVMRPDERRRVLVKADELLATALHALRQRQHEPDAFREALRARTRRPVATIAIVALNIAMFALVRMSGSDADALARWGGSVGPLTTNGEWWRLVTAAFVHTGLVHLVVDVAALAQAAVIVESSLGHVAFAGVYLTSAAFAASMALYATPLAVGAGASGAIFGIHGLLVALVVRGTVQRSPFTLPLRVVRRLAPAALLFVAYYASNGGAEWRAGLATFVIGFAVGVALTRQVAERAPSARRVLPLAATALAITMAVVTPLAGMTDVRAEVDRLTATESATAEVYAKATEQFKAGRIKADALAQVIERAILPELQAGRSRLTAVRGVPRQQQPLVNDADEYLRLRAESWTLRATALHKLSSRMLREADQKERASLAVLDRVKTQRS